MANEKKQKRIMITVKKFAEEQKITNYIVIKSIKSGNSIGGKKDGIWYIEPSTFKKNSESMIGNTIKKSPLYQENIENSKESSFQKNKFGKIIMYSSETGEGKILLKTGDKINFNIELWSSGDDIPKYGLDVEIKENGEVIPHKIIDTDVMTEKSNAKIVWGIIMVISGLALIITGILIMVNSHWSNWSHFFQNVVIWLWIGLILCVNGTNLINNKSIF